MPPIVYAMKLCAPSFHFTVAIGYRSLTPNRESLSLPDWTAPFGPVRVASTPTFSDPEAAARLTEACPPAIGEANAYVGAMKRKSARASTPAVMRPLRGNEAEPPSSPEL